MTNQIPLWVTFTLGLIAITGPIIGAWIGGSIAADETIVDGFKEKKTKNDAGNEKRHARNSDTGETDAPHPTWQ
jgi:hypothetical protein